jgi:hypothetical protein
MLTIFLPTDVEYLFLNNHVTGLFRADQQTLRDSVTPPIADFLSPTNKYYSPVPCYFYSELSSLPVNESEEISRRTISQRGDNR